MKNKQLRPMTKFEAKFAKKLDKEFRNELTPTEIAMRHIMLLLSGVDKKHQEWVYDLQCAIADLIEIVRNEKKYEK